MSYAFVQDIAASWQEYQRVTATTVEPAPAGLILHVAGPTDEGLRIIEVWQSESAWKRFQAERLAPVLARLARAARPQPTFRGFHARHVIVGAAIATPGEPPVATGTDCYRRKRPGRGGKGSS
jgi:hypothetical protein